MTVSEVVKNGVTYIREVHENGVVTEHVKPSEDDLLPPEPRPPEPTETERLRQEVAELKEQLAAVKETTDATAMAVVDIGMAVMMP